MVGWKFNLNSKRPLFTGKISNISDLFSLLLNHYTSCLSTNLIKFSSNHNITSRLKWLSSHNILPIIYNPAKTLHHRSYLRFFTYPNNPLLLKLKESNLIVISQPVLDRWTAYPVTVTISQDKTLSLSDTGYNYWKNLRSAISCPCILDNLIFITIIDPTWGRSDEILNELEKLLDKSRESSPQPTSPPQPQNPVNNSFGTSTYTPLISYTKTEKPRQYSDFTNYSYPIYPVIASRQ